MGNWIGANGGRLIYGGGKSGLMGIVADATLAAGGTAYGVIPRNLEQREVAHRGLTELHVVETMNERKQMMIAQADAFVALPGGMGTLEEMFEVWTLLMLGFHAKPVGMLNTLGYFDGLTAYLHTQREKEFLSQGQLDLLWSDAEIGPLMRRLLPAI